MTWLVNQIGLSVDNVLWGFFGYSTLTILFAVYLLTRKKKKRFFSALESALSEGAVSGLEDIRDLYKGTMKRRPGEKKLGESLNVLLREFLVTILEKAKTKGDKEQTQVKQWKSTIQKIIKENEEKYPFADLPDIERSVALDVLRHAKAKDIQRTREKLIEMANLYTARMADYDRVRRLSRVSATIALLGLCTSLYFGATKHTFKNKELKEILDKTFKSSDVDTAEKEKKTGRKGASLND